MVRMTSVTFPAAVIKMPGRSNLWKGRVYFGSQFEPAVHQGRERWERREGGWEGLEGAGKGREGVRKGRKGMTDDREAAGHAVSQLNASVLFVFSFLFSPGTQPLGWCHPYLKQPRNFLKTLPVVSS